jgi:hypothetical protein
MYLRAILDHRRGNWTLDPIGPPHGRRLIKCDIVAELSSRVSHTLTNPALTFGRIVQENTQWDPPVGKFASIPQIAWGTHATQQKV